MMSECREKPGPLMLAEANSSISTAQWPKSPPPPPYSSGSEVHSRPSRPAFSQVSRSTQPALSHSAWRGRHSRSTKRRTVARNISWSSRYTVRVIITGFAMSNERFAGFRLVAHDFRAGVALAVPGGERIGARGKFRHAYGVDVLQRAAGPGGEADTEDGTDVGVGDVSEHALLQASRRFDRLDIEYAVLQFLHVPGGAGFFEQALQLGPQEFLSARRIFVESGAAGAPRPLEFVHHAIDQRNAGCCLYALPSAARSPTACLRTIWESFIDTSSA